MIFRLWRGRASADQAAAYQDHLATRVFPTLRAIPGYLGSQLLRREIGAEREFLVITRWSTPDAIRAFAGDALDVAVVEPEARSVLTHADEHVEHFELVLEDADVVGRERG